MDCILSANHHACQKIVGRINMNHHRSSFPITNSTQPHLMWLNENCFISVGLKQAGCTEELSWAAWNIICGNAQSAKIAIVIQYIPDDFTHSLYSEILCQTNQLDTCWHLFETIHKVMFVQSNGSTCSRVPNNSHWFLVMS